jgi:hypothetical protein
MWLIKTIMNHPFGNGRQTTYLWWWLGDGLWHCFTHITEPPNHGKFMVF